MKKKTCAICKKEYEEEALLYMGANNKDVCCSCHPKNSGLNNKENKVEKIDARWGLELDKNEKIIMEFGMGKNFIAYDAISGGIISVILIPFIIGVFLLPMGLFYTLFYLKRACRYALTDKRVISVSGWLNKSKVYIDYANITDISINQKFIDRKLGVGELKINTAGGPSNEIIMKAIQDPVKIKDKIYEIRDALSKPKDFPVSRESPMHYTDEIEKLAELKNRGIISVEEFDAKKKQLLG
jgi:membrane protein YdbS with pleckstrin-like domain